MDWKRHYDRVKSDLTRKGYTGEILKMMCICIRHECLIEGNFNEDTYTNIKQSISRVFYA